MVIYFRVGRQDGCYFSRWQSIVLVAFFFGQMLVALNIRIFAVLFMMSYKSVLDGFGYLHSFTFTIFGRMMVVRLLEVGKRAGNYERYSNFAKLCFDVDKNYKWEFGLIII